MIKIKVLPLENTFETSQKLQASISGKVVCLYLRRPFSIKLQAFICQGFIVSKVLGFLALVKLLALTCKGVPY